MEIEVKGIDELTTALRDIDTKLERKIIRQQLRAGAKEMGTAVKAATPTHSGLTKKSYKVRAIKKSRKFIGVMLCLLKTEAVKWYQSFAEMGHKGGKRGATVRKDVPGHHAMKRGFDEKGQPIADQIVSGIWENMRQEIEQGSH